MKEDNNKSFEPKAQKNPLLCGFIVIALPVGKSGNLHKATSVKKEGKKSKKTGGER